MMNNNFRFSRRRFLGTIPPGLASFSTAILINSCTKQTPTPTAPNSSPSSSSNLTESSGSKTKVLRFGYQQAGDLVKVTNSDIKVKSMPNVEARGAFIEGRIPVWVSGDPHYALAEKLNRIRVIKTAQGLDSPGSYYVGNRNFARQNLEILKIVIEEIDKVEQWADKHRTEVAKLIAPEQKLELDVMQKVIDRRTFGRRAISPELIKEQQRIADIFFKNGLVPKQINIQEALLTNEEYAAITPANISQS